MILIVYPHNKRNTVDVQANIQRFEEYKLKGPLFAWQLSTTLHGNNMGAHGVPFRDALLRTVPQVEEISLKET